MNLPRILICDTYYPDFLRSLAFDLNSTYEVELQKVLDRKFGTADFYSRNLKALGWDAVDVIANHQPLQQLWGRENDWIDDILFAQMDDFDPDVIFFQDLSLLSRSRLKDVSSGFDKASGYCLAAQCSCPWPGDDKIRQCEVIFTSFPHYVKRIEALGVRAVYNPLAFEESLVYKRVKIGETKAFGRIHGGATLFKEVLRQEERIHDCVFIGGVGNPSHWTYGMEVLETVAREIPTFKWWGYGVETLPGNSALRAKYQGQAWGLDMYEILLQSKICLNRHGEVSEGFANNMRMYEATGCGAMLLTDNRTDLFSDYEVMRYFSPADAVYKIRAYLQEFPEGKSAYAAAGQARTLRDHTYQNRMRTVSFILKEMLVAA